MSESSAASSMPGSSEALFRLWDQRDPNPPVVPTFALVGEPPSYKALAIRFSPLQIRTVGKTWRELYHVRRRAYGLSI
ncbi:MAG: hypothetical protein ACREVC_12105 [Burkholderiales bacterium]